MTELSEVPVVTIVRVRPNEGRKPEVLKWFKDISLAASGFDGHIKSEIFETPAEIFPKEVLSIFVFDTLAHGKSWEGSDERAQRLVAGRFLFSQPEKKQELTGMNILFQRGAANNGGPQKWKILIVTSLTIFILIRTIVSWAHDLFLSFGAPEWIWGPVSVTLMAYLMTYVLMPAITKIFSGWLYQRGA